MNSSTHEHQKIRIVVIGCGMAGYSHLVECSFHKNIEVKAVCTRNGSHAKQCAEQFGIPLYFDKTSECINYLNNEIDIVVFSIPPASLEQELKYCVGGSFQIVMEKPGVKIGDSALLDRSSFYYSRRSYSDFRSITQWLMEGFQHGKSVKYHVNGPYTERYTNGETYLSGLKDRGILLDTVCHFFDMYFDAVDAPFIIDYAMLNGKPETSCVIAGFCLGTPVEIKVMDTRQKNATEQWVLDIGNTSWKVKNDKFEISYHGLITQMGKREYTFPFTEEIIAFSQKRMTNAIISPQKNNKILNLIEQIYHVAEEYETRGYRFPNKI